MTILDASFLIAQLDATDVHHRRAVRAEPIEDAVAASVVTLAEVLVHSVKKGEEDERLELFGDMEIRSVAIGAGAILELARLRAETRLKLPDCCVLLAARTADADTLASFDDRLREAAANRRLALLPAAL